MPRARTKGLRGIVRNLSYDFDVCRCRFVVLLGRVGIALNNAIYYSSLMDSINIFRYSIASLGPFGFDRESNRPRDRAPEASHSSTTATIDWRPTFATWLFSINHSRL